MDMSYSAVHSKESLARPWEVGAWGGGGAQTKVACQRVPHLPGVGLPWSPRYAQSLADSSLWEAWPQHKLGDEFQSLTPGALSQLCFL